MSAPTSPTGAQSSTNPQPIAPNLAEAATRIDQELHRRPSEPMVLSAKASDRLAVVHAEYLGDVGQEAVRIARRANLGTVDETHVDQANSYLGRPTSKSAIETAANTLGGVFAGAAIASIYSITFTEGPHGIAEMVVTIILTIIGVALLATGMTLTMVRRNR